jgi:hypothetical protein
MIEWYGLNTIFKQLSSPPLYATQFLTPQSPGSPLADHDGPTIIRVNGGLSNDEPQQALVDDRGHEEAVREPEKLRGALPGRASCAGIGGGHER